MVVAGEVDHVLTMPAAAGLAPDESLDGKSVQPRTPEFPPAGIPDTTGANFSRSQSRLRCRCNVDQEPTAARNRVLSARA